MRDPRGVRRWAVIAVATALGALASIALALIFADADTRAADAAFKDLAREDAQAINGALARVPDVLVALRAHFEAMEHPVDRADFARFASAVRESLALGVRQTSWAPRVTAEQRAGFEQAVRAEGFADFEIREHDDASRMVRAAERAEYFPVLYTDPAEAMSRVLGFDFASEPIRRQALTRARETIRPAATTPLQLHVMATPNATAFVTFIAVRGGNVREPGTVRGVITAILEADGLVEGVLAGRPAEKDLDLYVFDPTAPFGNRLIYWHSGRARPTAVFAPSEAAMRARTHVETRLQVADREWGLLLARPSSKPAGTRGSRGLAALMIGFAATFGAAAYSIGTLRHALRLEAVSERLRRTGADLRSKAEQIAHLARHDALTGLSNRAAFQERLQTALREAADERAVCVLSIDLDRFTVVNDTFGHSAGDALLAAIGTRLGGCVRAGDTAARMGGDEFAVLLAVQAPHEADVVARRIVAAIGQPNEIAGQRITVGVSIGIAFPSADWTEDAHAADRLMRDAQFALGCVKQAERGTWRFFSSEMEAAARARRAMEVDLRRALSENAFDLHFQPFVRLSDRRVCGFEALLRWDRPGHGPVSPAEFVPLAEECGLLVQIGHWILHTACAAAASWPAPVRVAVNLSAAQFATPALVASVKGAIAAAGLDPARLELEITETLLLRDSREVLAILRALKALGVSISMDDFGTGYSSLSYLIRFPFDVLKIDQSFVRDMPLRADCQAVVHAVTGLCRTLGITTIAEGVETPEQLLGVLAEGCDEVQGFLFSQPVLAREVAGLLTDCRRFAAV
jgi:diguanylate cyclase (GGDEF)-like protein